MKKLFVAAYLLFSMGLLSPAHADKGHKLHVVTTVAPLTNIVQNIGGNRVDLHGLIPEGTDSHTFEPAPSDVKVIAAGELFFLNGLHLETPSEKLIGANKNKSARVVRLGDSTITQKEWVFDFSFPESGGDPNPHLWLSVAHAMKYAEITRDVLSQVDPGNKTTYEANAKVYLARLDKLDKGIMETFKTIPPKNRKLLTYHDSWAYFCPRYGCKVIGAIQPSSFSQPSPREMASLIDQLKAENVPAIFGSEVFPSKVLDQIGREAGVKFISTLRDDDLPGEPNSPYHTYIGMMLEDVETMAKVLGGNSDALKGIDPSNISSK